MRVPGLESDLCEPFKPVSELSVLMYTVLPSMTGISAEINPQPELFREVSVRTGHYVMAFKPCYPAAQETSRVALLQDTFALLCHLSMILVSSSFDRGIGSPMLSMSCRR